MTRGGRRSCSTPRRAARAERPASASCASRCCACRPSCAPTAPAPTAANSASATPTTPAPRSARRRCARPRCSTSTARATSPPSTQPAAAGLVVPEMQIVHETTVAGYVNFMRDTVRTASAASTAWRNRRDDAGRLHGGAGAGRQADRTGRSRANRKLMYGGMPAALADRDRGRGRVDRDSGAQRHRHQPGPSTAPGATGSNGALTLVSPEFRSSLSEDRDGPTPTPRAASSCARPARWPRSGPPRRSR